MSVNAHLYFGNYISDRRQEFNALTEWILTRLKTKTKAYYPNFILMGDLNLDFDNPRTDRDRIET
jgi:endonuclease/exonuclease/phosphatase family metal-dependent hydrolase